MKFQRLTVAAFLALLLVSSAPVARADGTYNPDPGPQGLVASIGDLLSQAVVLGLGIVSSAL